MRQIIYEHNSDYFTVMIPIFLSPLQPVMIIQLLESPIPAPPPPPPPAPSQKASSDDISGTKRGTIDPLVSKRPEKNSE